MSNTLSDINEAVQLNFLHTMNKKYITCEAMLKLTIIQQNISFTRSSSAWLIAQPWSWWYLCALIVHCVLPRAFHQHDPGTSHTVVEPTEKASPLGKTTRTTNLACTLCYNKRTVDPNIHEATIRRTHQCKWV